MVSYKGKKIADKGFVINLPYRMDRRYHTELVLKKYGFGGYEYIDGVIYDDPEWRVYGATQSFLNCAKIALDEGLESIIIFEDDIKVMNGTQESDFDKIFEKWDKFYDYFDLIGMGTRPLEGARIERIDEHFGKVSNALCAQAFLYKRNFLEYFYETLKNYNDPNDPYYRVIHDEFFNDCCSHEILCKQKNKLFNVGITIPMLFTQRDGYSDNLQCYEKYDEYLERCYWDALRLEEEEKK
jgi:hypothetical protein